MNKTDKIMSFVAPITIAVAMGLILLGLTRTTSVSSDNNVYVRYIACTLSVPPIERDAEIIGQCWDHVIEEAGRSVHRYDEKGDIHPWLQNY